MHNAAFEAMGIDAEYRRFDIDPARPEDLENFCYETDLNNVGGFSVTMPYKQLIMDLMDYFDPLVKILGSMNTVLNEDSNLIGYNTDCMGAMQALKEKAEIKGKKALLIGAGGAGRAIAYGLREHGADLYIVSKTDEEAQALADEFEVNTIDFRKIKDADFDIIVHATPVGMTPNTSESLLSKDQIKKGSVLMDIVTSPLETKLIQEAKKAGAATISGERMLLHQACGQFEIWTGKGAPIEVMEKALYAALSV
jgi:shikimate dehydrogenase